MDFKYTISKSELHKCGVYVIKHNRSKKTYVGSSKKIYYRIARHKCDLVKNKHCNQHLQNAINFREGFLKKSEVWKFGDIFL